MKIVVGASSFGAADKDAVALLDRHGCEVTPNPYGRKLTEDETIAFLAGADGILAGLEPLNRRVLESCRGQLKALARIGIGMDNVDREAAREFGIRVSNTPEGPTQGVAEMTLAALLSLCRRLPTANAKLHRREWGKELGRSIQGLTVLLVGYGRIGRSVGDLLEKLGAEIIVYDPLGAPDLSIASLREGLGRADAVSLHASGDRPIIGAAELEAMRDGALLLNSARGALVDEEALGAALRSGKLAGCWLDVFGEEPYKGPLCDCETALLTPHLATYTDKCRKDMELQAVRNLLRDLGVVGS